MKRILLSILALSSLLYSDININFQNNIVQYNLTDLNNYKIKNVFLYKNNQYVGNGDINSTTGAFKTIDTGNYQVIVVAVDSTGKTQYLSKIQEIKTSVINIAPTTNMDYNIHNKTLSLSGLSVDKDGTISKEGFYIYDLNGKLIKSFDSKTAVIDLNSGKYQVIAYSIDDKGEKTYKSEYIEIKDYIENSINYSIGTPSLKYNKSLNDKEYYSAYSFHDKIGSFSAYEQGWTGAGIKVGILDSGIDYNHFDLKNNIVGVYSVLSYSDLAKQGYDDFRHGTQVAGVIAAEKNNSGVLGVAYEADIISVKVLNQSGSGTYANVGAGAKIATDTGAKVTNISSGGSFSLDTSMYVSGFDYAVSHDNSLIFAAGNQGTKCTFNGSTYSGCNFPGALPLIYPELLKKSGAWIVVGSVDKNGNMSSYSNTAGLQKDFFMVAPGGNISTSELIYTTKPGDTYGYTYGTSFAAPMVTGAFALLAQKYPFLTGAQIRDILFSTATDLGAVGVDDIFGHGSLNISKAMQPIGTLNVKTTQFSTSKNVGSVVGSSLVQSTSMNLNISDLNSVLGVDSYNRGFNVNMNSKPLEHRYDVSDFNQFEAKKFIAGFNEEKQTILLGYNFDYFALKVSYEQTVFGTKGEGVTTIDGKTFYTTLETNLGLDGFKFSNTLGYSKPEVSGMFTDITEVYGLSQDLSYTFCNFTLGAKTPMRVFKGELTSNIPTVQTSSGDILDNTQTTSLKANSDYTVYAKYEIKF